ncbi:hypothetical protein ACRRTK_019401 [Alexandromys fortis]
MVFHPPCCSRTAVGQAVRLWLSGCHPRPSGIGGHIEWQLYVVSEENRGFAPRQQGSLQAAPQILPSCQRHHLSSVRSLVLEVCSVLPATVKQRRLSVQMSQRLTGSESQKKPRDSKKKSDSIETTVLIKRECGNMKESFIFGDV